MATEVAFTDARMLAFQAGSFQNKSWDSLSAKVAMDKNMRVDGMPIGPSHIHVHDARQLQASAPSASEFFHRYGFVLLRHASAVRHWATDPAMPADENEISRIYHREVEDMVQTQLYPNWGVSEIEQRPNVVRRGPGVVNETGQTATYGVLAHQDYALDADDYEDNSRGLPSPYGGEIVAKEWRDKFDGDDVRGMMVVCFWRPVHMDEPLRSMPLMVCDPKSVKRDDMIRVGYPGPSGQTTNLMMLRHNPGQKWYFYPEMTCDEVVVFKQFDFFKEDREPILRTAFHSAFKDLQAPKHCAERQSCEHRITVYFDKPRPQMACL